MGSIDEAVPKMSRSPAAMRVIPLLIIALLCVLFFLLHLDRYVSLGWLRENRDVLRAYVDDHEVLAAILFVGLYMAISAASVPGSAAMTMAAGFLFGIWVGAAFSVIGAILGASIIFVLARLAIGNALRERAGPFISKMASGFSKHAFSYMLFLRLAPIFPFWAVNLAAAAVGMPFRVFVTSTAIGIIPGSTVFATFGSELDRIFREGGEISVGSVLSPSLTLALMGLAFLSLLPVIARKLKRRGNHVNDNAQPKS